MARFENQPNPSTDTRLVTTGVRPLRVAIFMDKNDSDWMQTCLRIIEWSTSLWGGWYSVIIPTDGEEIAEPFWDILKAFDPDYLYTYQKTDLDLQISHPNKFTEDFEKQFQLWVERYPNENSESGRKRIFELSLKQEIETFDLSNNLKKQLYSRLNPFEYGDEEHRNVHGCIAQQDKIGYPLTEIKFPLQGFAKRLNPERIEQFVDLEIDASLPIQLMVHSLYGKFWSKQRGLLPTSDSVRVSFATPSLSEIGGILGNLWDNQRHLYEGTPTAASLLKCVFYRSRRNNEPHTPLLFILGDGAEDYCLYHSLSRLRRSVIWLPKSLLEAYGARHLNTIIPDSIISKDEASLAFTAFVPMMGNQFHSGNPLFSSISLKDEELMDTATKFIQEALSSSGGTEEIQPSIGHGINEMLPYILRLYEDSNGENRSREQFHDGHSVNLLTPPKPKHFGQIPPSDFHWITETIIEGYTLPARPDFGRLTVQATNYENCYVRVTADGFGFFCPNIFSGFGDVDHTLVRPTLHIMDDFEVFRRIFESGGYSARYSDKGDYQRQVTTKFRGLQELADYLIQPHNYRLLDEYIKPVKNNSGYGFRGDRRYLTFKDLTSVLAFEHDAVEAIQYLIKREVLYRGFVFKCEFCRNSAWYPIGSVTHEFTCSRCRKSQIYTKQHWREQDEPEWFYQLDEVVYQAYLNNFHVPVLTLNLLQKSALFSFLYVPEIGLHKDAASSNPERELDVCCCIDGKIVIGECKKVSRELTERDLRKYGEIASAIDADRVVFSTLGKEWGEEIKRKAREILGGREIKWITRSELYGDVV